METSIVHRLDRKFPNLKGCLFIITYGRTGSTVLQGLISTIPGSVIRGENFGVMESLWDSVKRANEAKSKWARFDPDVSHPWHGASQIRPKRFGAAMVDAFIDHVLCPPKNVEWIGFKEIRYSSVGDDLPEVLDFMKSHFKNSHFIFNTRRKADVVKSGWWPNWRLEDVTALVDNLDRRFAEYHSNYPECSTMTSYESFTSDPFALAPLFEKLGVPLNKEKIQTVLDRKLTH